MLLPANDETTVPGTILTVAVESRADPVPGRPGQSHHTLARGVATATRIEGGKATRCQTFRFTTGSELWTWTDYVRHPRQPVWLWAHGLGRVLTPTDFWGRLTAGDFALHRRAVQGDGVRTNAQLRDWHNRTIKGLIVHDDPPTILCGFHRTGWRIQMLDARNYWPIPLSELASLVGVEIPSTPVAGADDPDQWRRPEAAALAIQSAVVRVTLWHRSQQMGRFGWTVAALAMSGFRHRWMEHSIDTPESPTQRAWEREALFAGRCEPFWVGRIRGGSYTAHDRSIADGGLFDAPPTGPFHLIDSSSFYGAVQAYELLPAQQLGGNVDDGGETLTPDQLGADTMASVLIASDTAEFPVRINGRAVLAKGCYWTTLAGPELQRAVASAAVAKVGRWSKYRMEPVFGSFSCDMWTARQAAEKAGDRLIGSIVKSILCRLHGKFAQRDKSWLDVPDRVSPEPWSQWVELHSDPPRSERWRSIGFDCQKQQPPSDGKFCFPALTAWVASHGREWLRTWLNVAGARHALYCATDALIVDDQGRRNLERAGLMQPGNLGGLRLVLSADDIEVRGVGNYTIGDRDVIAGRDAAGVRSTDTTYWVDDTESLTETLARGGKPTIRSDRRIKTLPRPETQGRVGPGGWVEPIVLDPSAGE